MLVPALTFLLGLALGAAVIGVAFGQDRAAPAGAPAPPSAAVPQPTPSGLVARVPDACLRTADKADVAYQILDDAVAAARELDARRLQELVDRVQKERAGTETLARACRAQAGTAVTDRAPTTGG